MFSSTSCFLTLGSSARGLVPRSLFKNPLMENSILDVHNKLKDVQRKLSALKRQRSHEAPNESKQHRRCHFTLMVAVMLFVMQGFEEPLALGYLRQKRRQHPDADTWTRADLQRQWETLCPTDQTLLLHPQRTPYWRAFKAASQFKEEIGLFDWVAIQNDAKGLAPSKKNVIQQRRMHACSSARPNSRMSETKLFTTKTRAEYQWLARWSKRWQMRVGIFPDGDRLPLTELRAKVGVTKSRRVFSFRAQKRSPENGHILWVK